MTSRPVASEYAPYYGGYVDQVPEGDILKIMTDQQQAIREVLARIAEDKAEYRYAEDKWSIKEVVGHMVDTELVFVYRALRIARTDDTPLPGFDQDRFVAGASFETQSLSTLTEMFHHVRAFTVLMLSGLEVAAWSRQGVASGHGVTVRALAWIMAGHAQHHLNVLQQRYLI